MKRIVTIMLLFVGAGVMSLYGAKTIYATLDKKTHTFCIYYDEYREGRPYVCKEWTWVEGTQNVPQEDLNEIYSIDFDESMKEITPFKTEQWFANMTKLKNIKHLEFFETKNSSTMFKMFYNCKSLIYLDLSPLNVKNIQTMNSMFEGCEKLAVLDISSFNLRKSSGSSVNVSCNRMFARCSNLRVIFSPEKEMFSGDEEKYPGKDMFLGCKLLTGGNGTKYDPEHIDSSYGTYDSEGHPGYFTSVEESENPKLYSMLSADCTTLTIRYDKELGPNRGIADWTLYNNYCGINPICNLFAIEKIILDETVKTAQSKSTAKFFYCFEHLKEIENLSYLNTVKAVDMSYMFAGCKALKSLDLSTFMTSDATSMERMFYQCEELENLNISGFYTANVTNMSYMFAECPKLKKLNLTSFNTANVTNMAGMFKKCKELNELNFPAASFNTEKVTDMSEMFSGCHSLQSLYLRYFNTGQVTTMKGMFESCLDLKEVDICSFDFSHVKDVSRMFFIAPDLETIYCNSDLSQMPNIAESKSIFDGCLKLVGGAGTSYMAAGGGSIDYARPDDEDNPGFFTSTIESKTAEVYGKLSEDGKTLTIYYDKRRPIVGGRTDWSVYNNNPLNKNAETNRVTKVVIDESLKKAKPKTTEAWFANFRYLKTIANLDYLNTADVTSMKDMFMHCDSLVDMSVSGFDTKNVTDMSGMFADCGKLRKLDVSKFNTSNVTDMSHMFSECKNVMALKVDNFDTRNVTNMAYMFNNCVYAFPLKVSNFDTRNVTDMSYMFYGCKYETYIDVSRFNTANVTDMTAMFGECKNLGALDLRNFDVSKVKELDKMFSNDSSLYYLYANQDWSSFASLEYSYAMFYGCPNLRGGTGTKYNEMYVDATYARPDEEGNPGYFTVVAEIYATWDEGNTTLTLRYDGNREANNGVSNWAVYNNVATKVVLDETMKKAEPESTKDWFYSFSLLEEIEHLDYLSTYSVKDMSYMFAGCSSLSVLNVNSFYLSWAESTEGMFSYCLNLKTIWCDHNWHEQLYNKNSKDMFLGCTSLIGGKGTAYDANYVNSSRACTDSNLRYGYFTAIPEGAEDLSGNELYAVLESDNKTLTIRYDKDRISHSGVTDWYPYCSKAGTYKVETIVLDPSVADARPLSTKDWFRWFNDLTSVTGLEYLNTENVTDMNAMFAECTSLSSLDVSHFNTQNVTNMGFMFSNCTSLKALDLSHFDTRKVSILYNMFENCESLTELDIRQFETNEVTDMTMLFANCKALKALDVTALKTGKVTDMTGLFAGCEQLTTLDVSGLDMSSITSLIGMFYGCKSLKTIYCNDDWSKLPSLVYHNDMFTDCTELVGGNNTVYSADNANDVSFAHVGTAGKPGYFTTNITHQVTLTAENGKIEVAEKEIDLAAVPEGTVLHLTAIPDNGYLLDSWSGYNGTELVVDEDKEVVANFAVQTFTVTFKDWNDELIDQQVVEWGKSAVAPEDPVREDYLFMGWSPSDFSTVYENMTITAQYEFIIKYYTVTLVAENGKIAVEEDVDLTYVENGTLLHLTATPDYGYTFDHWENYDPESGLVVNGDITVTAYFSPMLFTLTVVAEPAEGGTFILSGVDMNNQASYMTDYYIEAVPNEGYEFVEWRDGDEVLDNKTPEMSGALYGDVTIVGVFKVKINMFTVTYYDWNGDELFVEQVEEGKDAQGPKSDPTREGYTFTGWDKPLTNITADLNVQALYEENKVYFTVTYYDWNGDEIFVEQVEEGKDAKGPDSDPTREGYTFIGWSKPLTNITSDLLVIAQYEKSKVYYTVTFLDWDATELLQEKVEEGHDAQGPETDPEREGYTFIGWSKPITNITSNLTVIAQYEKKDPTGVDDVRRDDVRCTKVLRDGVLYLMYEGQMYDVRGQRVR